MATVLVVLALVLAAGGLVCVVWAERGGPRWARVVAAATIGAGGLLGKRRRRGLGGSGGSDNDGGDDDG